MTQFQHEVTEEQNKTRVDKLLAAINPERSRSQIQGWISKGHVFVNEAEVKANYKCQTGEVLTWSIPEVEELNIQGEDIPLEIIYEDSDLIVINKPKGMVVHPSAGHQTGTLVNALLHHCKDLSGINSVERPGIVHRIDKDTSGLLVVAKNDHTHMKLSEQLATKEVKRKYEAIVHGEIGHESGIIDAPIGRDPKDRQKMGIVDSGKPAVTHFKVIKHFPDYTHVECQLETGRTHQIRVHMRYIGFPLVGDPKYGQRKTLDADGQALHAKTLGFTHPRTNEWMEFEVEAPKVFQEVLGKIKNMY
ncbi:RluA family pseudouridine synthase [Oceanobacillus profundus]|uniref:Pseudouridine synthase n=1 Tax=Oceanobacillus profundus TaxID=372463 RepID=A0A417YK86_9BACI|nr:RluA family pseudouridine synthase [Oceanobacillus profundus]MBR3119465.1 RluA family pseudouridine synthase [Oceanobacillus sp.]MDO6449723.1 RluA family pseudouridine synthase [Oceanobacillus profundus]PAE30104.1 RluA family pseudouridine synthase [Paenibacillus sp. 7884-2]RHW33725.1 RluA family pseudouridine synthase [Oceanobacillus profundus]